MFTRSFWARGVRSHRLGGWGCANSSEKTVAPTEQFKPVPPKCTSPIHWILTIIRSKQVPALDLAMGSPQNSPRRPAPGENGSWIAACQNRHTHRVQRIAGTCSNAPTQQTPLLAQPSLRCLLTSSLSTVCSQTLRTTCIFNFYPARASPNPTDAQKRTPHAPKHVKMIQFLY